MRALLCLILGSLFTAMEINIILSIPKIISKTDNVSKPIKPFIWQLRQAPEFVYRITPQDPVVFDTHTYVYGTSARGAIGFSQAWLSSRSGS